MTNIPSVATQGSPSTSGSPPKLPTADVGGSRSIARAAPEDAARSNAKPGVAGPVKVAPTPDELKKLVGEMQRKVSARSSDLQFTIDQDSGKTVVKVTDSATRQVVWQFPSEEAMHVSKELGRFQKGALVSRKA